MAKDKVPELENGLSASDRKEVAKKLGGVLDSTYSLMVLTQIYHWNVEGPMFDTVHKLTQAQYTALFAAVDEIAERMRALDAKPAINKNGFPSGAPSVPESQSAESMIAHLVREHEGVVRQMREVVEAADEAGDVVTSDLLTGMMAQHEKDAWMLRSLLRG